MPPSSAPTAPPVLSLHGLRKTVPGGRVLFVGLDLARAIIEAHRGHIWVENRSAGGAQISFSLPRYE
jgi:signal transduction histidine kinase